MNTDTKILLRNAERAAGMGDLDFDYAEREGHGFYHGTRLPMPQGVLMAAMHTYWNPDTDSGDSRDLQVKLKISLEWDEEMNRWEASKSVGFRTIVKFDTDPNMAVLLVAAELGKAMKEGE